MFTTAGRSAACCALDDEAHCRIRGQSWPGHWSGGISAGAHLHNEQLVAAVQRQCNYDGDLRGDHSPKVSPSTFKAVVSHCRRQDQVLFRGQLRHESRGY